MSDTRKQEIHVAVPGDSYDGPQRTVVVRDAIHMTKDTSNNLVVYGEEGKTLAMFNEWANAIVQDSDFSA